VLAASWERSVKHGLQRQDSELFGTSISLVAAKRVEDENRTLLAHANAEMLQLFKGLGSAQWVVLCANARGQIVSFVGDRSAAPRQLRVLMQPGRVILEAEVGTTAPGCALEERRPVVVRRGEHFLIEFETLFCASAPILAPDGQLAGALDITGIDVRALPLACDMVDFAVRRIENSMLRGIFDCTLLRFHCDGRMLGTPFEAILAVHPDGTIRGANRAAWQALSLDEGCRVGMPLGSIFEGGLGRILTRAASRGDEPIRVRSHTGSFAFLSLAGDEPSESFSARRRPSCHRDTSKHENFIMEDPALVASYDRAVRIARSGLPVILRGETGTGKEVFARALHNAIRPDGPFLAINCVAIPEGLIEAELFGYVDGAFTGGRKGGAAGKIEQAQGGVLFLDEIGDMPTALQSRLLRVLQSRTITRIGESREVPVDLLVICATHRDLQLLITEGQFREDLYYRLNGDTVHLPPLRERSDVAAIIEGLLRRWHAAAGASGAAFEPHLVIRPTALKYLASYSWPGNIRQLEQVIRVLLALHTSDTAISVSDLPSYVRNQCTSNDVQSERTLEIAQLDAIRGALQEHSGNVSSAARSLGISRGTLYNKLKRFGLTTRAARAPIS
jgi:transcriptional regulator of acetoin/glycerol metabolism